jgi:hypothetical protein
MSWLPTIVLPFSSLHLYHIERVNQTRFVHKGSTKFRGILLLGWIGFHEQRFHAPKELSGTIKCCINSFGVGLHKDSYKACLVGEVFPCPAQVLVSKYVQKDCNMELVWKPGERGVKEVWTLYLDSQTTKSLVFWRGHNIVLGKCTTLNLAIHKLTINFELFELE